MRSALLIFVTALCLAAQTIVAPTPITQRNILTWENPNPANITAFASVYAIPVGGGVLRKATSLTNGIPLVNLFGGANNGTYQVYQTFTDTDGLEGDPSTNIFLYWSGGRLKGGHNLRTR